MSGAPAAVTRRLRGAWLVAALLLLATLRMGALVLHDPMIGVANNYDMIRVQACIDAYPDRPADVPPGSNSYNAPLSKYRFTENVGAPCFLTSEALFAFAALPAMRWSAAASERHTFDLRLVGALKMIALLVSACALSWAWWRDGQPAWSIGNAVMAVVVLADPAVTLYANTFYAEFAAVFFAYAALGLAALAWTRGRIGTLAMAGLALLLALAILSKIQHVVLGVFVLGVLFVLWLARRRAPRRLVIALVLGALCGTAVQGWHMQSAGTQSISYANKTNTILYTVLGQSADPARTAAVLGLPPHCAAHAGENWFSAGVAERHPCPELLQMSRLALVSLLWRDPGTLPRVFVVTLERMRGWVVPVLGKVESGVLAPLPGTFATLDVIVTKAPIWLFALWLLAPGAAALLLAFRARSRGTNAVVFVLLILGLFPWLSLPVVALGDGAADAAKQSHLALTAAVAAWTAIFVVFVEKITNKNNSLDDNRQVLI